LTWDPPVVAAIAVTIIELRRRISRPLVSRDRRGESSPRLSCGRVLVCPRKRVSECLLGVERLLAAQGPVRRGAATR
jgi:hypothetical protein